MVNLYFAQVFPAMNLGKTWGETWEPEKHAQIVSSFQCLRLFGPSLTLTSRKLPIGFP